MRKYESASSRATCCKLSAITTLVIDWGHCRLWLSTMNISEFAVFFMSSSWSCSSGLSGLSMISLYSEFMEDLGYSPDSAVSKLLLNLSRLQSVSRESSDKSKSASLSAMASIDE